VPPLRVLPANRPSASPRPQTCQCLTKDASRKQASASLKVLATNTPVPHYTFFSGALPSLLGVSPWASALALLSLFCFRVIGCHPCSAQSLPSFPTPYIALPSRLGLSIGALSLFYSSCLASGEVQGDISFEPSLLSIAVQACVMDDSSEGVFLLNKINFIKLYLSADKTATKAEIEQAWTEERQERQNRFELQKLKLENRKDELHLEVTFCLFQAVATRDILTSVRPGSSSCSCTCTCERYQACGARVPCKCFLYFHSLLLV
jgi:hypothetical protein